MTSLSRRLLDVLTDEPQSKWELQEKLAERRGKIMICPCERDVRRAIAELRSLGFNIASSSDQKGYWLGDEVARQRTINELRSRAMKLLKTADALEKGPDMGQLEVEV
jgi:hypothetical protein